MAGRFHADYLAGLNFIPSLLVELLENVLEVHLQLMSSISSDALLILFTVPSDLQPCPHPHLERLRNYVNKCYQAVMTSRRTWGNVMYMIISFDQGSYTISIFARFSML